MHVCSIIIYLQSTHGIHVALPILASLVTTAALITFVSPSPKRRQCKHVQCSILPVTGCNVYLLEGGGITDRFSYVLGIPWRIKILVHPYSGIVTAWLRACCKGPIGINSLVRWKLRVLIRQTGIIFRRAPRAPFGKNSTMWCGKQVRACTAKSLNTAGNPKTCNKPVMSCSKPANIYLNFLAVILIQTILCMKIYSCFYRLGEDWRANVGATNGWMPSQNSTISSELKPWLTNSTTHGVGEIWLTCGLFPGFCQEKCWDPKSGTTGYHKANAPTKQHGPLFWHNQDLQVAVPLAQFLLKNIPTKQTLLTNKEYSPLTGYIVWRAKIGKVCSRLFITYGFVKQFLNGHVLQKFGDNYFIPTTIEQACSMGSATSSQPPRLSNFGYFNFCNLFGDLIKHQSCGIAAPPPNWTNETEKQVVVPYVSSICWIHLGEGFATICGLDAPPNHIERSLPGMLARRTAWNQYFSSVVSGTVCVKQKFHILHHFLTARMLSTVWIVRVWTRQFKMFHFLPILVCYVNVSGGQLYKFMHVMGLLICKQGLEPCRETVWLHNFSWNHITPFWMSFKASYSSWTLRVFWLLMILLQTLMSTYPYPPMLTMLLANFVERRRKSWQIYRCLLTNALILSLLALAWGRTVTNKNMSLFLQRLERVLTTELYFVTTCWQEKFVGKLDTWALHIHTFNGSHASEVDERLVAAKLGWVACGRFWSRLHSAHKGKLCVFHGMVYTPLLAGLETCVLDKSAYKKLDACVLRYGRKLMQGQACRKIEQDDGTIKYKAQPSSAVFAFLRLLPCKDELFIRRVRWYQSMARSPSLHSIWFACMFGNFSFEPHPVVASNGSISPHAHPWAQQFHSDVCRLAEIEGGDTLVWLLAGQPLRLFTDLRDDFLRLDVTFFRRIPFGVAIPPPEFQPSPGPLPQGLLIQNEENAEIDDKFSCTCLKADGEPCDAKFSTARGLAVHISNTQGGTHGAIPDYRKLTVTNQCVFCKHVFSSLRTTKNHIRHSLQAGRCTGQGSQTVFTPQPPKSLQCTFCHWQAAGLDALLDHLAGHAQRPGVQVE